MPNYGYAANRPSRLVLAAIVGGHAAALAALMLVKMEVYREPPPGSIEVTNIPIEPPPPEPLPEPKIEPEPRTTATVTAIRPPIAIPNPSPVFPTSPLNVDDFRPVPPGRTDVYAELVVPKLPAEPIIAFVPPKPAFGVKPRGNPGSWVTNDDYPDAALRNEEQGRTAFRLDVGADGRLTACSVTASSGSRVLDGAACKLLMRRARFVAGRDSDGVPVGGSYANSFNWKIPEG